MSLEEEKRDRGCGVGRVRSERERNREIREDRGR